MKTSKKVAIIIACSLIALGLLIGGVLLALLSLTNLTFFQTEELQETYTLTDAFSNIDVSVEGDLSFQSTEAQECTVRVSGSKRQSITYTAQVQNDTLVVRSVDHRKWYERIGIDFDSVRVSIDLPQQTYDKLCATTVSGDIQALTCDRNCEFTAVELQSTSGSISFEVPADNLRAKTVSGDLNLSNVRSGMLDAQTTSGKLTVQNCNADDLNAQTTSGDLEINGVNMVGDAAIQTTSGELDIENLRSDALTVKSSSGDIDLGDTLVKAHMALKTVSGDIELDGCDAETLSIKTTSGDVDGTLLTEKLFRPDTTSGEITLPHTAEGGLCEIKTTSGDIHIEIQK